MRFSRIGSIRSVLIAGVTVASLGMFGATAYADDAPADPLPSASVEMAPNTDAAHHDLTQLKTTGQEVADGSAAANPDTLPMGTDEAPTSHGGSPAAADDVAQPSITSPVEHVTSNAEVGTSPTASATATGTAADSTTTGNTATTFADNSPTSTADLIAPSVADTSNPALGDTANQWANQAAAELIVEEGISASPDDAGAIAPIFGPTKPVSSASDTMALPLEAIAAEPTAEAMNQIQSLGELNTPQKVARAVEAVCAAGEYCVGVGQVYTTIQAAIDAAGSGATVRVFAGNYGPFIVTKALQIVAATGEDVTVTLTPGDSGEQNAIDVQANGVTISGFSLVCSDFNGYSKGINVSGVNGVMIDGVSTLECQRGVSLFTTSDVTIQNSEFKEHQNGQDSSAIWSDVSTNTKVLNNAFKDQNTGTNFNTFDGVTVSGNTFDDGMGTASVFWKGKNGQFNSNVVTGTTGAGVYVTGVEGFSANGNTFTSGEGRGFSLGSPGGASSGVAITGNTFKNMGNDSIYFNEGSLKDDATVTGNDFRLTPQAIGVDENVGAVVDASGGNLYGACGPNAIDRINLGGSKTTGSESVLNLVLDRCENPPAPPTFRQATCTAPATYYIPGDQENAPGWRPGQLNYSVDDTATASGTYAAGSSSRTVTVAAGRQASGGMTFADATTTWTIPAATVPTGCAEAITPVVTEPSPITTTPGKKPTTPTTTPTNPTGSTPSPAPTTPAQLAGLKADAATPTGTLAATGANTATPLATLAAMLLLAGAALVVVRRKAAQR